MDELFNEIISKIGGVKFYIEKFPDLEDEPGYVDPNLDYNDIKKDLKASYGDNVGEWLSDFIDQNADEFEEFVICKYDKYN